jgi:hypothetical protein
MLMLQHYVFQQLSGKEFVHEDYVIFKRFVNSCHGG